MKRAVKKANEVSKLFFGEELSEDVEITNYHGGERVLVNIGRPVEIWYKAAKKGQDPDTIYRHEFERGKTEKTKKAAMYFDEENNTIILFIPELEITAGGIED